MRIDSTLDLRGAPSGTLTERVATATDRLPVGALVEVVLSESDVVPGLTAWVRTAGFTLLESSQLGQVRRLVFRKG